MISAHQLCRDFVVRRKGVVHAVHDVTFDIRPGEMVGYIGPNGAGKSTTIKMLTGILVPTSGRLDVAGVEPSRHRHALARRIGVVFGQRTTLWWDLPLRDSFELLRKIYRIPDQTYRANLDRYCELLDLGDLLDTPVRQLSLGQRMRGDLTAALLHDPAILFLDEPTIGLDIVSKGRVRAFLRELNAAHGTTLVLTTHDLADIEALCDRVIVIDHGRVMFDGGIDELRGRAAARRTLVVDLTDEAPPLQVPGAVVERVEGPRQWLSFPLGASAAPLVAAIAGSYDVADLSLPEPAIEDVIRELYGHSA